jgi:glycine/D-amino acid oxidase-like deaminating enzyme
MLKLPNQEVSYWQKSVPESSYPKLNSDIEVDVAIVGGGISGLSAGYLLKKAGKTVAIMERGKIGRGTTGNTTGKVTSQHNLIYSNLVNKFGEKTARLYGEANQQAIGQIENIINKENINCDWQSNDNYIYTRELKQVKTYQDEAKTAQKLGLPATFETKTPLPFEVKGAVRFTNQAQFNSVKYLHGLAKAIDGNGSYIFEHTRAIGIHDGKQSKARARNGGINAKNIIVATNVPTPPLIARFGYCLLEYPQTSYIVAARLNTKLSGMYISTDKNEYSILPVSLADGHLLLIGGESHIRDIKFNKKTRYQRLADYAEERFGVSSVDYRWSAWDYLAYDSMPLVGRIYPWSKHLYTVTAFRKWGLSNSMVAAMILRDLITGQKNQLSAIYTPLRASPIKSIPEVIYEYIKG